MFSRDYVFTVVKVLTSTVNNNGQFQKISIPIAQTAFRFPKGRGVHNNYVIPRAWGVFMIGNLKAEGDFTGGISGVESAKLL